MNRTPIKWLLLKKKRNVYPGSLRQNQMFRPSETTEVWKRPTITSFNSSIEYRLDVLRATNGAYTEVY